MTEKTLPTAPEDQQRIEGPKRIQRQRTKGWRMPEGAVYVGRPTRWGNPFVIGEPLTFPYAGLIGPGDYVRGQLHAVHLFGAYARITSGFDLIVRDLAGKDLCCWCERGEPCHADVLIEMANDPARTRRIEGRTT